MRKYCATLLFQGCVLTVFLHGETRCLTVSSETGPLENRFCCQMNNFTINTIAASDAKLCFCSSVNPPPPLLSLRAHDLNRPPRPPLIFSGQTEQLLLHLVSASQHTTIKEQFESEVCLLCTEQQHCLQTQFMG